MTTKEIKAEIDHFKNLDFSLQYWCFEHFVKNNLKDADYFIAYIEAQKEKSNGNS